MKKFLKWTGFVVAGLFGLVLLGIAYIYFASERELGRQYTVADGAALVIPSDAREIAEGRRIAQLAGCMHCHGDDLAGTVVDDIPNLVRLVAPNISTRLPHYTDAQLATVLRKGVKPDGKSVLFMPSEMFRHLRDEDLARVIAFLRSKPAVAQGVTEETQLRPIGRLIIANGDYKPAAHAIELLPSAAAGFDANDPVSRGRYLTMNYCSECHAQDLQGVAPINAPALAVVKGYSLEQFTRLMQEGVGLGDRQLKLMSPTAKARFTQFSADEIAAVHAFLQSI
ncbi:MAG TPA: c-type cytochrome [Steroidobacteraceae bacterium]|nr:c-type cytochrome [Steroidobacteraceae bacterium]